MQESKVKCYRMTPEEIKKRYGAPGEYAEDNDDQETRQLNEDLYRRKEVAIRRMASGRRRVHD